MTDRTPSIRLIPVLRVSTDDKGQDPERQHDQIKSWAAREGVELGPAFKDEGVSGDTDPFDRPGFLEAIETAREKGFTGLVVEAPDRLSRGGIGRYFVAAHRLSEEHRLKVFCADQSLAQQEGFAGEILLAIKAAMAKEWLDRHRKAVKSGMERARRNGSFIGAKPKPFTPEEEALIRSELAKGPKDPTKKGYKSIAHEINRRRGAFEIVDPVARKRKCISSMTIRRLAKAWQTVSGVVQNAPGVVEHGV